MTLNHQHYAFDCLFVCFGILVFVFSIGLKQLVKLFTLFTISCSFVGFCYDILEIKIMHNSSVEVC